MANLPAKKLTNIRPREVSFVDNAANEKDFLVVKNKKTDLGVLKKLEIAIHSICFWKSTYPDVQSVKDFLIKQGVDPEIGQYVDRDWEIQYVVNDESLFEGTSLAASVYVPMNKGVDSLIGVVKNLKGDMDIEKKGAKVSSKNLSKIKEAFVSLKSLLDELEEPKVTTTTEVTKTAEDKAVADKVIADAAVKKAAEDKAAEDKAAEDKAAADKAAEEAKPAEEKPAVEVDTEVEKRLAALETKVVSKDEEIEVLKKKIEGLENLPSDKKGESVDGTVEVKKSRGSLWNGVL